MAIGGASDASSVTVSSSLITGNIAQGGRGGSGASAGDGSGGGAFIGAAGAASFDETNFFANSAIGAGVGGAGIDAAVST